MALSDLNDLVKNVEDKTDKYDINADVDLTKHIILDAKDKVRDIIFEKGLSKRIWD